MPEMLKGCIRAVSDVLVHKESLLIKILIRTTKRMGKIICIDIEIHCSFGISLNHQFINIKLQAQYCLKSQKKK